MSSSLGNVVPLILATMMFGGCTSTAEKSPDETASVSDASIMASEQEGASLQSAAEGGAWAGSPLEDPESPLYTKTIYFAFDSSEVDSRYHEVLAAHADYLANNPGAMLRIEGNCDERGSREYNIALGERRANAVMQLLLVGGADLSQMVVVSYGEERPVDMGQNEEAWAINRRADLVY